MNNYLSSLKLDLDISNMKEAISSFPNQIENAFELISNNNLNKAYFNINSIIVIGMGGSAIGGDVARVICQDDCKLPIFINRSYSIPKWVNEKTLVIASSYSGNTEETLSAFNLCMQKKCSIIVLSTGGKLLDYASKFNLDNIKLPSSLQPRAALGYSFTLILLLLNKLGYVNDNIINLVHQSIPNLIDLSENMTKEKNNALNIAKRIHLFCPIIYCSEDLTWVVALRFRGQLAENAKMLSFHNNFPEQNHNEIEGWTKNIEIMKKMSIIWIKDKDDHKLVKSRMDITSKIIKNSGDQLEISQSGANKIERLLKLIHYTDWISYYAALLNKIDPTPVKRIMQLKSEMANLT